jgi:hypothetical protein
MPSAESFFATYEKELIRTRQWNSLTEERSRHSSGSRATTIAVDDTLRSNT